jgi:hypothetical protein
VDELVNRIATLIPSTTERAGLEEDAELAVFLQYVGRALKFRGKCGRSNEGLDMKQRRDRIERRASARVDPRYLGGSK